MWFIAAATAAYAYYIDITHNIYISLTIDLIALVIHVLFPFSLQVWKYCRCWTIWGESKVLKVYKGYRSNTNIQTEDDRATWNIDSCQIKSICCAAKLTRRNPETHPQKPMNTE